MSDNPDVWYVQPVFLMADCQASLRSCAALDFAASFWHEGMPVEALSDPNGNEPFFGRDD
jgi:hypothetical protein